VDPRSSRLEPRKMKKMKQKSLIIFVTFTALMFTNFAFADDIVLTAELSASKFNPGDFVGISGNLTGIFSPVNVTIDIMNGTDFTIIDSFNATTVDDVTANYTATYDLTGAELGEYLANMTYGDYYVELIFEVEATELEEDKVPDTLEGVEEDCDDLSFAIERAEIYLERVRGMLASYMEEYDETSDLYEKLLELEAILDTAEEYLANARIALEEGDCNAAARNHAAARNLMGRVKGILNSVIKEHKVQKAEKFIEQFERRISSTQNKVNQLSARFGTSNTESIDAKFGIAWGQVKKLQGAVNVSNVDDVLQSLMNNTEQFDADLESLGDEEAVSVIKNMNRYEAKVKVLEKTAARLQRKGGNNEEFAAQLSDTEERMAQLRAQLGEMNLDGFDEAFDEVNDALKGLKNSTKGNNGKSSSTNGKAIGRTKPKAVKP